MNIEFSEVETERYYEFCKKHRECVSGKFGAIGGGIEIHATGTGLGWLLEVECHGCGETEDITDTDCW